MLGRARTGCWLGGRDPAGKSNTAAPSSGRLLQSHSAKCVDKQLTQLLKRSEISKLRQRRQRKLCCHLSNKTDLIRVQKYGSSSESRNAYKSATKSVRICVNYSEQTMPGRHVLVQCTCIINITFFSSAEVPAYCVSVLPFWLSVYLHYPASNP